ncbi:MAG: Na+/H+ antiporter subunit B [Cytophagaceae bacterium]
MKSFILYTATTYLLPILLLFSVYLLFRGHNEPGGGFVGGLVAAAAHALYVIPHGIKKGRKTLPLKPHYIFLAGLSLCLLAGCIGLFTNQTFMKGVFMDVYIPVLEKPGSPFLFDLGVFMVVEGSILTMIFNLTGE